ncbi:VCBS repeat-containing protein [Georgenia sp. EYE_87]|uniref:FG-GAP-like repeat-containing protein n=1 Tax=Georgenia sp. EYE_87 TaxID=2853448 RepID=UPI002005B5BB|nr:FG-GAP-like repeat-containing protein [Georgenia sp. EYE_87]MCK6212250.1 VCBS repeat-containing protein [Georgenia sp. EYE_87]
MRTAARGRPALLRTVGIASSAALLGALAVALPPGAAAAPVPWEHDTTVDLLALDKNFAPAPTVADWDGDGRDDLVVGLRSSDQLGGVAVALREDDGDLAPLVPAFDSGTATSTTGWTLYMRPAVGDWDGDGDQDLLFGTYSSNKGVLLCENVAEAGAPVVRGEDCTPLRTAAGALVGATTGSTVAYVSPELVDWDLDGDLDLLVGTGASAAEKAVRLYRNVGSATTPVLAGPVTVVARSSTAGLAGESYFEPTVVDIDDDGRRDLLVAGSQVGASREFTLHQCLNTGTDAAPSFAACSPTRLPGLVNNTVAATDWDEDGYLDLLRGFHSGFITNPVTLLHGRAPDSDGDGMSDSIDNCVAVPNPPDMMLDKANAVQIDTDRDGLGDVCDPDDDADAVVDTADICPLTTNEDQSDVDGDGRGDVCDARDDRPAHPGAGTYEVAQADRIGWGRKPVIMLRADAMSVGYRSEIAEALSTEAIDRGLPFSLALIPWDTARLAGSGTPEFLSSVIADPNFEVVHHGTYHTCVYTPYVEKYGPSAAEFDCGMDVSRAFNLLRVGQQAITDTVDTDRASHQLTGFIPPTDAYDDAAGEAMQAAGYSWVSSAWYAEPAGREDFAYVDDTGLVHIPWSQIACGNGAASWTNCQAPVSQGIAAHSGVDCDVAELCAPTRDGKDYSDWQRHADNSLADRCENDFDRYGMCEVLFELTSYDGDFATGSLDARAFAGYQQTLTELEDLAGRTGAVFMTLGDYAAALQAEDHVAPAIAVATPEGAEYSYTGTFTVDVEVSDDLSGVHHVEITLDGEAVADGANVDLAALALGEHVLSVTAEDVAGNRSTSEVTFTVIDDVAPEITVLSPTAGAYLHHETVVVDVAVTDARSDVAEVAVTLDGEPVDDGATIDLLDLALGDHTLAVVATDAAGNRSDASVTFTVEATVGSLRATVERYVADGSITNPGTITSLRQLLDAAGTAVADGRTGAAANQLGAFEHLLAAQSGRHVPDEVAGLLRTDSAAVRGALGRPRV